MAKTFNPPPNWPQPSKHWVPAPDWRPDPAWGPAPEGWQLWIETGTDPDPVAEEPSPVKRIFLSYRRSDCQPQANAINDGLRHRLASAKIFMDVDSIPAGVDFEQHIREEIQICDVVLVVIGDDWLSASDREGRRRIDDPDDFVRLEIEAAFASPRVSVVPVLVERAEMPRSADLPESIKRLARINAIELSDQRWSSDIERLASEIKRLQEYQEARAQRVEQVPPAGEINPPEATRVTPNMRLADVAAEAVRAVVESMPGVFRTKDVSEHPYTRYAHGAVAGASNYHTMIGRYLAANHVQLTLAAPEPATDNRGAVWRRTSIVPAPKEATLAPAQLTQPAHSAGPMAASPNTSDSPTVGWIMVAIPIVSLGVLSFVPSLWVASKRSVDRRLMNRSLLIASTFFLVLVISIVMAISKVGFDSDTYLIWACAPIAAGLAAVQRNPTRALTQHS